MQSPILLQTIECVCIRIDMHLQNIKNANASDVRLNFKIFFMNEYNHSNHSNLKIIN